MSGSQREVINTTAIVDHPAIEQLAESIEAKEVELFTSSSEYY